MRWRALGERVGVRPAARKVSAAVCGWPRPKARGVA